MRDAARQAVNPRTDRGAKRLVLISGAGALPVEAARHLVRRGESVTTLCFRGMTDPRLEAEVDETIWVELGQLAKTRRALEASGARRSLLVGKVPKTVLGPQQGVFHPDAEALEILEAHRDRSDEGLMGLIAAWLEAAGMQILDQGVALSDLLASSGPLTERGPDAAARRDLEAGRPLLDDLAEAGTGQCVVLKAGDLIAVEGSEGTDETIRRAGRRAGPGATVVKGLRTNQDARFDRPAIGPGTIAAMREVGATSLAIEAGETLLLDRERTLADADAAGITVWGFDRQGTGS